MVTSPAGLSDRNKRPKSAKNILLVSFDDAVAPWPYKDVLGEPLQLPNLDRLCSVATTFKSAYAQSPICGASRGSMMTSLLPHQLGIFDNSTFVFEKIDTGACWVFQLKQSGYFCSSGGKVHHKPTLNSGDYRALYSDDPQSFSSDLRMPREMRKRSKSFGGSRKGRGALDGVDDDFFFDKQSADSAIEFLSQYDGAAPFYREVGFFSPHGPHITPARFKETYDHSKFKKPDSWNGYIADSPYVIENITENEEFRDNEYWQKSIRNYFSTYSHGDYHLGRILDALRSSRHASDTVVIILSDHGFHLGNRNLFRKTTLWEQSLQVPFVVYDPEFPTGREIDDPVALIDIGATVLDFAGVNLPQGTQGRSLRPMMHGERDPDRVIPSFYKNWMTIRKGDFRIIRYSENDYQLFDVKTDFWQLNDLGPDHAMFAPMHASLQVWAKANDYRFHQSEMQIAI